MKALLDTCVLSELRNAANAPLLAQTLDLFESSDLYISVISIGEIAKGIALLPSSKKKTALQHWAHHLEKNYSENLLSIDREIVQVWGEITATAQLRGKIIHMADGLIAATALVHGLHVMTRNVSDFIPTGVLVLNPWLE